LIEKIVNSDTEKTYARLKAVLLEKGCRIVSEQPPTSVSVVQGSIWGVTPKAAEKTLNFSLTIEGSKTKVSASANVTSKWRNLAIVGTALAAIVALLCFWIGLDLQAFVAGAEPRFWSWIVTGSSVALVLANLLAKLSFGLAFFLVVVIGLEVFVAFYVSRHVEEFAEECLKTLG
jgi:hypothetical protein